MCEKFAGVKIDDEAEFPLNLFPIPRCYHDDLSAVLIPQDLILNRIQQLAREIHARIGDQPLLLLCVLNGCYRFFTELVQALSEVRHQCKSAIQVEFIRARSYLDQSSTGNVSIEGLSALEILQGKQVLLVDDIIDTGLTITRLVGMLNQQKSSIDDNNREASDDEQQNNPQVGKEGRVWTVVLLSKRTALRRQDACHEDFVAFNIPDKFIVGFGMDYNQAFRDLDHICVMSKHGVERWRSNGKRRRDNGNSNEKKKLKAVDDESKGDKNPEMLNGNLKTNGTLEGK